jgi:PKD repeat protein
MLLIVASASSQYTTKHYIAPSPWSYFSRYNELVITTLSTSPVAVTIASSSGTVYTNSATTVAGAPLRYRFSANDASANLSGVVLSGQGLYVSASVPIGVQVRNIASDNYTYSGLGPGDLTSCVQKGNSAFTSLGDQGLGTSFRLGYYANVTGQTCYSGESGAPLYSVLAITNNTSVYVNGTLLKTLQAGQSFLFQANIGSLVTSNNNIVVNTGMRGDNSSGCADGVESQVIPTNNLGTTYVVVRSNGNTGYEKTTIVATQASTTVTVRVPSTNTTNTYTLSNAGDYVTINNGDGANAYTTNYITSTSPVAVYTGSADGCEIDMIVQPPLSSCSGSFDVQTNRFLSNSNDGNAVLPYFGYIVIQSDTAIVYFNGTNLESIVGNRTQIGTTGYYIIKYTSTQLGNPSNLRFVVNARINAALIESGAGYSMSAFISSISNAMPPPSASSNCLPTTFTAQGGFSSYQWYKDGVLVSGATSQTYSPSVAGSYSVAGTTASCGTTAQSTSVLVNPKPNAGSDFVACANQVDTLTATSTISGGSWIALPTNPTGATLSNTTNNVSTVSFSNTAGGTYQFAFSVGCSDTLVATINPLPTVAAITGITSVCIGKTSTLSNATSGGVWSSAAPSVATINLNGLVTAVGVGTSVISYTVTNANGCSNTVTTTVTVNALPTVAAITGTTNACVGATTTLGNTTGGGVWSSSNTSVATINASGVVTGVNNGTSVISYTVTNANGCVTTVTTTVTINALPIVPAIAGNLNVCVGATTILSNTTSGGVWSSSNTSVATINTSGVVTGVNNGTTVITYRVTNANGCVTSVNATVTVNALPSVASISGTNSICAGTTTTFSNTTTGGVWSSGTTSVATINASGVINGISTGNSVITYTYTNANGCSNSTTRTITVNAQPTVAAISGLNSACLGSGTTTLSNTTSGGTWSSSVTSVATISSSGVVTSVAAGTTTISYTVNGSGGCSTTQTLLFTVKAKSTSTTNASICAGGSYTFNGTVYTTAGTYTMTLVNAVGCDSVATLVLTVKATSASTTNTSICPSALPYSWNGLTLTAAGIYIKTLTNAVGCDSIARLILTVKATSASTTNTSICPSALPYSWNGLTLNAAGIYIKTLTNAVGCDSIATLVLTVKATSASTTNASICTGGSYTFNGTVYTTAGSYTKTLTNAVGCDSVATLVLTVKATSASTTNTSICPSALPYSWNGLTLTAAGTYAKTLVNAVGCDSIATLNLTVKATSASTTNASICAGGSYTFNGTVYTTAGTYTKTLTNSVGCDSVATLVLTVKATSASTTNTSICPSALPYSWNGLTLNSAGTFTKTLTNAVGCDSVATLNLTVKATSASTINTSICPSALPYSWNGLTLTAAGTYAKTLVNAVGCDSVATLVLTVKATSASTTNTSICPSVLPYSWNGLTLNAAGTYTKTLTNAVGCDSVATLVLTVKATSASTTNISICPSALPYSWNGLTLTAAGTYAKTLVNSVGCDSIATLNLTVKATSASTTNASICAGGSYTFNGTVYTTAGTYTKTLTNSVGCDSVATLVLTVKATSASTTNTSICPSALPYSWNGLTLTAAGTYTKTLVNAVGCDSIATLNLTVKATSASTTNASICAGGSYTFNGTVYTTAGTYTKNLINAVGCDSVATLVLTVKATSASTTNTSICPSALPYSWNGLTLNAAGIYIKTLTNAVGCDSIATLVLTVKATSASTTNASICTGGSYTFNGTVYTTAGTYTKTLTNAVGCDSVATLVLTVKATSASTTNTSICPSALPYSWNGLTLNAAGTYAKTLVNAVGCDSVATLNLTVKATSASTTNTSICPSALPYSWNGLTLNAAGTYTKSLVNAVGCDSIATLNLTVKATSASTTNTSICPSALPYSWNGLTLNAAGTYTKTLTNAVGCDSVATLVLTVNPTTSSTTTASICSGNTYVFNGLSFTTTGTYSVRLTNRFGCDSVARLRLIVKPTSSSTTNASICAGGSYTFNGTVYTTAGTYTKTLVNAVGCDSIATLVLTVKATSASTTNTSICPSVLPYTWNGLTLTAAGNYTKTLVNAVGCDSVATLNLTVKAMSASITTAVLCAGNTYIFNGVTYNTPGTYVAHLTNYVGCDSAATLVLVGGAATASTTTMSICPSALPYSWNGLTFTGAGSQTAHLINASGCDSAATLVLTVKAALTSTTNATICGGNSYLFNGVTYTTSGTYNAYLASDLGCDSIATLVLTVLPKPNAGADKIVGYNNGNASITLSGIGTGVWLANATNTGSSVIVDATNATTEVKNFSKLGTYEYLYINGACSDTMKVSVLPNGNISSYVWVDTNEDGINNESTTNGINNLVIELYKEDANGNYVLAQTTTTATYNGKPGYYNFIIPENGNYKVKFPLVAQDGALTTQNLSTNTNNNSVANSTTGFSPVIAINTTGSGSSLNNTAIGAGYKYVASPNCNMTANIGVNQLSQCVTNNQYQFTGNFTGGTAPYTYLWDLNDGNYANTKDVTHTYAKAGEHDVTFIVKDSRGCEAHASTVQIAVGAKPKASFDIYTRTGNGDGFTFVSTSTITGGWMNYSWNLGNGTTSTLINPMTTYSPGTYTVTLVVIGNFGCSDTVTKVITVDSSNNYCSGPLANFSVNNIAQCLSGNSFVFTNTSTGNNNTYTWNFGDGTAATSNFNEQHTFTNTGTYNITLTVTNTCGTNTVTKTITVNGAPATPTAITGPTSVALGGVIGLSNATSGGVWSSANTAVATINNYGIVTGISAGNTVITYTVSNTCGTDSVSIPITVLAANSNCIAPLANFTINTNTQCLVGNNFIFSNSASGTALAYNWKFGDGTIANSANASHTFTQAGVYNVKLIVSNTCGTDSITKTVTVNAAPTQPQAITGNNSIVTGGTTTLSSTTTGGVWSSSNTAIATVSANGLVTGMASGSATITYTVTNTCGSASVSKIVLVSQACVPTSSTTTASICAGNSYTFNGTAYTTAGTYVAHLTNVAGCDSTATLVLTLKATSASTTTASICAGNSYSFNGTTYTTAGTYVAHFANAAGCDSAATLVLTVKATSASTTNASICAGGSYTFNGSVYTTAGTYVAHLTNAVGCDSIATLVLSVKQTTSSTTTASICAGNSYNFNGSAYTTAGTYVAHLTNAAGCDSVATLVLTVNSLPITLPSISGNTSLSAGTTSLLSNSVTGGTWSSSNTSIATVNANTGLVTGLSAGTTVITYTVTDACSNIVSTTTNVTVTPAIIPCNVQASFSVNNAQQCVTGNQFVFTNTTTGGIAPYTYLWQISEGSSATTKDFTKAFATYGEHDVHLKVIDANGCESNATAKHIVIGAKPVANFSVLSNTGNGASKTFISASTLAAGNMSYMWNLGNGMTSTLVNPTVTYVQGTYTVKLVVSGIGTCKDSVSQVINEVGVANVSVYPNPVVNTVQVSYRAASTTVTTIKLMDLNGRIIQTQQVLPVSVGTNLSAMFDFRNLQPGSYVIHVSDAQNGFLGSKTILKQ